MSYDRGLADLPDRGFLLEAVFVVGHDGMNPVATHRKSRWD